MKANTPNPGNSLFRHFLSEFLWEPLVMFQAVGDRYREVSKAKVAAQMFAAGLRVGREIERTEHDARHTCRLLPELQREETDERPL